MRSRWNACRVLNHNRERAALFSRILYLSIVDLRHLHTFLFFHLAIEILSAFSPHITEFQRVPPDLNRVPSDSTEILMGNKTSIRYLYLALLGFTGL